MSVAAGAARWTATPRSAGSSGDWRSSVAPRAASTIRLQLHADATRRLHAASRIAFASAGERARHRRQRSLFDGRADADARRRRVRHRYSIGRWLDATPHRGAVASTGATRPTRCGDGAPSHDGAASTRVWPERATVIAGFGGDLISHAYLEEQLLPSDDRSTLARLRAALHALVAAGLTLARSGFERARRSSTSRSCRCCCCSDTRDPSCRRSADGLSGVLEALGTPCWRCRGRCRSDRASRDARGSAWPHGRRGPSSATAARCESSTARERGRGRAIEFDFDACWSARRACRAVGAGARAKRGGAPHCARTSRRPTRTHRACAVARRRRARALPRLAAALAHSRRAADRMSHSIRR